MPCLNARVGAPLLRCAAQHESAHRRRARPPQRAQEVGAVGGAELHDEARVDKSEAYVAFPAFPDVPTAVAAAAAVGGHAGVPREDENISRVKVGMHKVVLQDHLQKALRPTRASASPAVRRAAPVRAQHRRQRLALKEALDEHLA